MRNTIVGKRVQYYNSVCRKIILLCSRDWQWMFFSMSRRWTRVLTIYLLPLLQFRRRQRLQMMMLRRWDSVNEFEKKVSKISSDSENFLNFQVSESDNCSSVATAQIPVPQQRSSIRRNEYVNIPIPQGVSISIRSISMWQYSQHPEEWIHDKHKISITDVHVLSCWPPSVGRTWAGLAC